MSIETLFDYLKSPEGAADLNALMAGRVSLHDIREMCDSHEIAGQGHSVYVYALARVSMMSSATDPWRRDKRD